MNIIPLKNYPDDGNHLEVVLPRNFPFEITKGLDPVSLAKKDKWCVSPRVNKYKHGDYQNIEEWFGTLPLSHHETPEAAYKEAVKQARIAAERYLMGLPEKIK